MKIAILVEGETEIAFKAPLDSFLKTRLAGNMPSLKFTRFDGPIPKHGKLRRRVERLLTGQKAVDAVIALTDVYGTKDFTDAADAKQKMAEWVGKNSDFYPHAAQYDFEAWLIPYWPEIKKLAGHNRNAPSKNPEQINHERPPSKRIAELFLAGSGRRRYSKWRDALRILKGQDLTVAAEKCPELKSFLNTILRLCSADPLP